MTTISQMSCKQLLDTKKQADEMIREVRSVLTDERYADDADFMDKHCRLMSIRKQVRDRLKRKRPVKKPKRKVKSKRSRK